MRLFLSVLLICCAFTVQAQHAEGIVIDNATKQPLPEATVTIFGTTLLTNARGGFNVILKPEGNVITVKHVGYKPYYYVANAYKAGDTIRIYLNPLIVKIDAVTISGRNYKLDSINNRAAFKDGFNYEAIRFKDIFISKPVGTRSVPGSAAPNSTSSIIGLNLLNVFNLLSTERKQKSRLQKRLLRGEAENFVDHKFSPQIVSSITKLEGDSLTAFMTRYRPDLEKARAMTGYDLVSYIKKCYDAFVGK